MAKQYAILLGVEEVNSSNYGGAHYPFSAAGKSTTFFNSYFSELQNSKFEILRPKGSEITSTFLLETLTKLKKEMTEGDILVIYFCGHSFQVLPEHSEWNLLHTDREDEGWGLYDRVFFHFELWMAVKDFAIGSRIVILSDSCYSGITGFDYFSGMEKSAFSEISSKKLPWFVPNLLLYNTILSSIQYVHLFDVKPSVIIIGSSGERQVIAPGLGETRMTEFSVAFHCAVNNIPSPKNLVELFDRINMHLITFHPLNFSRVDPTRHPESFCSLSSEEYTRVLPKWHYHQGHKYTKLRTQTPLFKNENF
ncbi:MAG: hypothetical protein MI810_08350 [Flavobacteriales bacterium]|nr:hypothetical protein [Flavobacteriales bacterium]